MEYTPLCNHPHSQTCELCSTDTSSVIEIAYSPDRYWILYSLFCVAILIAIGILSWILYKHF